MSIEIRKFRNRYDLELIQNSDEKIRIGDLFWDPIFGKPVTNEKGTPTNIFYSFKDSDIIDMKLYKKYIDDCDKIKMIDANLPEVERDLNVDVGLGFSILEKLKIADIEFKNEHIHSFQFKKIKKKKINIDLADVIDTNLEILKKDNWKAYDGKIRRVQMITELLYGEINIKIKNKNKANFELAIKNAGLDIKPNLETKAATNYSFINSKVPFAMKLVSVKNYNG